MILRRRPTLTMIQTIYALTAIRRVRLLIVTGAAAAPLLAASLLAGSLLMGTTRLQAQTAPRASSLPATPPTSLANQNSLTAPIAGLPSGAPSGESTLQRHKADVSYANGLLNVRSDNSSLNQILRDIAHETGMTIVGGVADQRIFGDYGPAAPGTVLKTLLDGTGTNMLLKETATEGPAELVLTPRAGGSTPPGPNSPTYDATEKEPRIGVAGAAQPAPNVPPRAVAPQPGAVTGAVTGPAAGAVPTVPGKTAANPPESQPKPSTASSANIAGAPHPLSPATASTPNAAKTPQQIFEELKQLQAQKKQSQPQPPSSTQPLTPKQSRKLLLQQQKQQNSSSPQQ